MGKGSKNLGKALPPFWAMPERKHFFYRSPSLRRKGSTWQRMPFVNAKVAPLLAGITNCDKEMHKYRWLQIFMLKKYEDFKNEEMQWPGKPRSGKIEMINSNRIFLTKSTIDKVERSN